MNEHGRRAWLAVLLALLNGVVAFAYVGRLGVGLVALALPFMLLAIAGWSGLIHHLAVFIGLFIVLALVYVAVVVWVWSLARKQSVRYRLCWYNRWYHYVWIAIVTITVSNIALGQRGVLFGYETFRITSASMIPTLQPGDFVMVDTRSETIESVHRYDLVTYRPRHHPDQNWVGRLIGLPGDDVSVQGHRAFIDGIPLHEPYLPEDIDAQVSGELPSTRIPSGDIFILGDNRPNAEDSRFVGPHPQSSVAGVVTMIWWSSDSSRIGRIPRILPFSRIAQ